MSIMSTSVGPNMSFLLHVYHSEAELQEEIESDRDLIRQGFMGEKEFKRKYSMCRIARELRHRDDIPSRDEAWLWYGDWGDILDAVRDT
jgi:hypothetical protein